MRFRDYTIDKQVRDAIADAERLLNIGSPMMNEIMKKNDFEYNSGSGMDVMTKIAACSKTAPVNFYRPFNPWTRALGYSDNTGVFINSRKFRSFTHADIVGLMIHEWLHFGPGFSHGNNFKTEHKVNHSVNYWCSENVARWL